MKLNHYLMEDALESLIDYRGKTPKKSDEGIPTLSAKSVKNGYIDYGECYYISPEEYKKFMVRGFPKVGDVLLTTEAPMGMVAKLDRDDVAIAQRLITLRGKEGVLDNDYLLYYLQSPIGQHKLAERETGSTVTGIKQAAFRKIEIDIPDIEIQRKIAACLSCIDAKISTNKLINRNLEQLARILLKKWMKDQNKEYELVPLTDVANINPKLYSEKDPWPYINYLDTSSITQGVISCIQFINPNIEKLPSRAKRIVQENDIIFSTVRPNQLHYGIIKEPMKNMLVSTGFAVVRSKYESVDSAILYLCLTDKEFIGTMQQLAEESTSTFPSIKPSDLNECRIPYPVSPQLAQTIDDLFTLISKNQHNSNQLSTLRESLIPKLLSGDIDICDLSI